MPNSPLNYHHLQLFWAVVQEGGVTRAGARLGLTQSTISGQLRLLEEALGVKLFEREGRRLVLTEAGKVTHRYADEIFSLGRELREVVRGEALSHPVLNVGLSDTLPKAVAHRLLQGVLLVAPRPRLVCVEDRTERLLDELALHKLDVVLADAPMPANHRIRAFHHHLGASPLTWMAAPKLASRLAVDFPRSLDGSPVLLPTPAAAVRRRIDLWLEGQGLRPEIVAEFDDSALMKTFGQSGAGAFPVPLAVVELVAQQYGVAPIGTTPVEEELYAITVERRIRNPAVAAITEAARRALTRS